MLRKIEVPVRDGRVACPHVKDGTIDVEQCYGCPDLCAFYDEESGTKVVCRVPLAFRGVRGELAKLWP